MIGIHKMTYEQVTTIGTSKQVPMNLRAPEIVDVAALVARASAASQKCQCEGRYGMKKFVRVCQECGVSSCLECSPKSGEHSNLHQCANQEIHVTDRVEPVFVMSEMKANLPMRFTLEGIDRHALESARSKSKTSSHKCSHWRQWLDIVDECMTGNEFRFSSIQRGFGWTATYTSISESGAVATAQLRIENGSAVWSLTVTPATRVVGSIRPIMQKPVARCVVDVPSAQSLLSGGAWQFRLPVNHAFKATLSGGPGNMHVPTWRSAIGILQHQKDVRNDKYVVNMQQEDVEYMTEDIRGEYSLLSHCNSAENSMYVRRSGASSSASSSASDVAPMYMFVDPDKCGAGTADSVVFSRSNRRALFGEVRHVVASLSPKWRPDHVVPTEGEGERERVNCTTNGSWLYLGKDGFDSTVTVVEHSDTGAIASVPATADEDKDARISLQPDSHERPTRIAECSVPSANTFAKLIATTEGRSEGKWVTMKSRSRRSLDEVSWLTGRINIPTQVRSFFFGFGLVFGFIFK